MVNKQIRAALLNMISFVLNLSQTLPIKRNLTMRLLHNFTFCSNIVTKYRYIYIFLFFLKYVSLKTVKSNSMYTYILNLLLPTVVTEMLERW